MVGVLGGGAYRVNWNGEQVLTPKQYGKLREEGWFDKAVNHPLKVFEEIEAGKAFTGWWVFPSYGKNICVLLCKIYTPYLHVEELFIFTCIAGVYSHMLMIIFIDLSFI